MDNPMVYGTLVSKDKKSALILADFRSEADRFRTGHDGAGGDLQGRSRHSEGNERAGITLRAAGTPIIVGWVNSEGLRYVAHRVWILSANYWTYSVVRVSHVQWSAFSRCEYLCSAL